MGDPKNASINGDGFRFYRWTDAETGEETDVLSVTSIRKLCGEPYNLVRWQINNVIDVVMGTVRRPKIGKRGKPLKNQTVSVMEEFPSEFAVMYDATQGDTEAGMELRTWLRDTADEPRNIAAMRGSIVHDCIERNVEWDRIERPFVEDAFGKLSYRDRERAKQGVKAEDVKFVRSAMRQYWDMRRENRFVIIARELQVFNLTAGYAGSFDALVWMVPEDWGDKPIPHAGGITLGWVKDNSSVDQLVLLDWKTSKDVYTDQVVQAHAYLSAEFVGTDGVKNDRLTDRLVAAHRGGLVHIRPEGWGVHLFDWEPAVTLAFLGSVAFARFLATYPRPTDLFSSDSTGVSPEEDTLEDFD